MQDLNSLTPKIWFNRVDIPSQSEGDCDCPGACPVQPVDATLGLVKTDIRQMSGNVYQQVVPLHWQICTADHWLACNSTGGGRVVVLNRLASFLFNLFQFPTTPVQVAQTASRVSPKIVEATVMQLVKLGLLEEMNAPIQALRWENPETLTVWLHITNECNLRCSYCFLHKTPDEMTDETARRAVEAIFRSAVRHHFKRVKLKYAGGEASLHFNQVLATHDYAERLAKSHSLELEAVLLSNGIALSSRLITELVARQIKVMISLDGLGAYHDVQRPFANGRGSFEQVQRTIERLLKNCWIPDISITVSERNLAGLPELIAYVLERDLPFSLNYYRENEYSTTVTDLRYNEAKMIEAMRSVFGVIEQNLPRRSLLGCLVDRANLSAPHRHTCGVGHNYLVVDQKGGIAKCQMDIQRTVTTIDMADPLALIRADQAGIQNLAVEEKEGCRTCEWRYWCTGGCSLLTHRMTGRYDVKSPNCAIYKALYPEVLRLEALRLLKYELPWTPSKLVP